MMATRPATRPIARLMIANRGEIARRIARTARSMGITTVGVYSEPDRNAPHVDDMDVAVALGGATPAESYLRGDAIIAAALRTGCDAVHPGYGFLAENADFAQAVVDAGLVWVGPTPDQIRLLGDKIAAKRTAIEAGVPTTSLVEVAPGAVPAGLTMPVLVKAAAGGGGRGMRVVHDESGLADAIESASREAASAFGDGTVFVEPLVMRARHVEVQIMGDAHGNVVHFHERECSIQRRSQKVLEEAPSPGINDEVRSRLHDGALALARHVGYRNAGTVEFLVGEDGTITFLEVNTRLQVEHRVTELICGVDLVELQLRVAAGEPLPMAQDEIRPYGHAMQVRLVAEDPAAGWLPSIGTVREFEVFAWEHSDTAAAVRAGSVVSADYDSLLMNVVRRGTSRDEAAVGLVADLAHARIAGVRTNAPTMIAILREPDFLAGNTTTAYLDEHPEVLTAGVPSLDTVTVHLLAVVFADERRARLADRFTGFAPSGWRNVRTQGQRRAWLLDGHPRDVEYVIAGQGATVLVGAPPAPGPDGVLAVDARVAHAVRLLEITDERQVLEIDGVRHAVEIMFDGGDAFTASRGVSLAWTRPPRFADHDADLAGSGPVSPLPGTVIAVHVEAGQTVEDGQLLMVVEAMKMEHKITAHGPAVVREVRFAAGDRVDAGDLLVVLEIPEMR
jgi:propionyl-CoA carboxylase alpha chain